MAADRPHPGITMHKLSFGGGFVGLLFAAGSVLIFVLGFPTLWYFVALAFGLGIAIAFFMRVIRNRQSQSYKPLSILTSSETKAVNPTERKRALRHLLPRLAAA